MIGNDKKEQPQIAGSISIGTTEKHEISFGIIDVLSSTPYSGIIKFKKEPYLVVDNEEINLKTKNPTFKNKPIDAKVSFFSGSINLKFEIGNIEKHNLEIKYAAPPILGFFFKSANRFIVQDNGKVVYDYGKLPWWGYFFMYLPFIFFFGGVIPMLIGLSGVWINYKIISRHRLNKTIRFVLLLIITLIYFVLATIYVMFTSLLEGEN